MRRFALTLVSSVLALLTLSGAAPASADVVMPAPERCPPGAAPALSHIGPHCVPTECAHSRECAERFRSPAPADAFVCEPLGLCIGRSELRGGRGGLAERQYVVRSCAADEDCPRGISCERSDRCRDTRDEAPFEGDAQLPYEIERSPPWARAVGPIVFALLLFFGAGAAWTLLRPGVAVVHSNSAVELAEVRVADTSATGDETEVAPRSDVEAKARRRHRG